MTFRVRIYIGNTIRKKKRTKKNKVGSKSSSWRVQITWTEEKTQGKECETPKLDSTHLPKLLLQFGSEFFFLIWNNDREAKIFKKTRSTNGINSKKSSSFFESINYIYKTRRIIDFLGSRETKREKKEYKKT